jgi:hypothetical protein
MSDAGRVELLSALSRFVPEIADHVTDETLAMVPAYAGYEDDLRLVTPKTIRTIIEHSLGVRTEVNPYLIDNARKRARQGFDGVTMTHAWRVVIHSLWTWLTEKCPIDFDLGGTGLVIWNEFLDTYERYVDAVLDAFFETLSELRAGELTSRRVALDLLLEGRSSEETAKVLGSLGIRTREVVILACSFNGTQPADATDQSFVFEPLLRELKAHIHQIPWTVIDRRLILCLPNNERTAESLRGLPDRLEPTMLFGVSRPSPVTKALPEAKRQAELALRGASRTTRLVEFGRLTLLQVAALQVELQSEDIPIELERFLLEDAKSDHEWMRTAEALSEARGSISAAARLLNVHTNTIYYRVNSARELSGLDLRSPQVLADLQFVQSCLDFGTYPGRRVVG